MSEKNQNSVYIRYGVVVKFDCGWLANYLVGGRYYTDDINEAVILQPDDVEELFGLDRQGMSMVEVKITGVKEFGSKSSKKFGGRLKELA